MSELGSLVELLGTETAVALIEAHGGTRISVPMSASAESPLRAELGDSGYLRLVQYFGGHLLQVPVARKWRIEVYDARGMTRREMARRLGCTEATVYKFLGRKRDERQLSMNI